MVRLIIRDDDCNFFTRPEDIERVYSQIPDFPVSFATVPTIMDVAGGCPETKGNITPRGIGDNAELVSYLKKRYEDGKCDILLHGITHGYHFRPDGSKIPEMIWRNDEGNLREQIKRTNHPILNISYILLPDKIEGIYHFFHLSDLSIKNNSGV